MVMYARDGPGACRVVDRWERGVGWFAHPAETGRRASHAIRGDDGVWLVDPLDAPGVDELVTELGAVAGVAVLSDFHARDAAIFADRYGVSVHLPPWLDRAADRVDAPVERFSTELGESGFRVAHYRPFPGWHEGLAYRASDGTLYVPEALGTAPFFTVDDERLGVYLLHRPVPPRDALAGLDPERILVGHGSGVLDDAGAALSDALDGARRRFPRALFESGGTQLHALVAAFGN